MAEHTLFAIMLGGAVGQFVGELCATRPQPAQHIDKSPRPIAIFLFPLN